MGWLRLLQAQLRLQGLVLLLRLALLPVMGLALELVLLEIVMLLGLGLLGLLL